MCLLWSGEAMGIPKQQARPGAEKADSVSKDEGKRFKKVKRNSQRESCFSNFNVVKSWQTVNEMFPCRIGDIAWSIYCRSFFIFLKRISVLHTHSLKIRGRKWNVTVQAHNFRTKDHKIQAEMSHIFLVWCSFGTFLLC